MPEGAKDVREWLTDQAAGSADAEDWPGMGRDPVGLLVSVAVRVTSPNAPAAESPADDGRADDDPGRPAEVFLGGYRHPDGLRLRYWNEEFFEWRDGVYAPVPTEDIRCLLAEAIDAEFGRLYRARRDEHVRNPDQAAKPPARRKASSRVVSDATLALKAIARIPPSDIPCWLDGAGAVTPAEITPAPNGLLLLPAFAAGRPGCLTPPTPRFFARHRVGFPVDPATPEPAGWLRFLSELWPGGPECVALLQEQMGYAIVPDTSLHKIMFIVGPPRSGKGTIAKTIRALVGDESVAAPALGYCLGGEEGDSRGRWAGIRSRMRGRGAAADRRGRV